MKSIFISICIFFASVSASLAKTGKQTLVVTSPSGSNMLLGPCDTSDLCREPFSVWYKAGFSNYLADPACCDSIKPYAGSHNIRLFFGTWCGDSRREVPRMMKVLMQAGFSPENISLVALGNADTLYKKSPGHEEQGLNIIRVPTLIISRDGRETGRIVESPVETIERDLVNIFRGRNYRPHYANQ